MTSSGHECNLDTCYCRGCEKQLSYSPIKGEHACFVPYCEFKLLDENPWMWGWIHYARFAL